MLTSALLRPLTPEQFDTWLQRACVVALIGMAAGLLAILTSWQPGLAIFMAAMFPAALMASLQRYRSERGLWMLALLFGGFACAFLALSVVMQVRDALRGAAPAGPRIAAAAAVAGVILHVTIRVCWTVFVVNRAVSRRAAS